MTIALNLRTNMARPLSWQEADQNLENLKNGITDAVAFSESAAYDPGTLGKAMVTREQSAEYAALVVQTLKPFTTGAAPFQVQVNSGANTGGGAGTYNHGVWYGFNASRHAGNVGVQTGKCAMIMGFEDNYYDAGNSNKWGPEWYIEYWSPNGTSQQMLRPFYCRVEGSDTNTASNCIILHDIGSDGLGQFTVFAQGMGARSYLMNLTPTLAVIYKPFTVMDTTEVTGSSVASALFKGGVYIDKKLFVTGDLLGNKANFGGLGGSFAYDTAGDRMAVGVLPSAPVSSVGAYIGWSNGVAGTSTGDLVLVPRTSINGAIRLFAGNGTPTQKFAANGTGLGFQGTAPIAKPTVTGSRGGNAALASLLTALASYGLITDSSSA